LLALALCLAAVVFLLRVERKQTPDVTRALWIPTVWMLYIASRPVTLWLKAQTQDPDASGPLDLVFLIILFLVALLVLSRRRSQWAGALSENPWLVALFVFMVLSVTWSAIPGTSLKRLIKDVLAVMMSLAVFSESSPRRAVESVLRRTTFILIPFSLVLIKYFPEYGVDYGRWSGNQEWLGVAQQKNSLALMCIISSIFLIWSLFRRWRKEDPPVWRYQTVTEVIILVLTFYLLGGPGHSLFYSATSIYALLAGLLCAAWIYLREKSGKRVKAGLLMAMTAFIVLFGVVTIFISGTSIKFFASSAGRDSTLTGRTQVWTSLLPVVVANPILGQGFGGFWTSKTRDAYEISGAHSGYLDVLLGTGLAGLILVTMFLLSSCRKASRELSGDLYWGLLWICYLVITLVHNIGESSLDSFTAQLTAVLLFFTICSSEKARGVQKTDGAPDEAETTCR
jgi:O-antigen ligase